jgi:hypothetical protein
MNMTQDELNNWLICCTNIVPFGYKHDTKEKYKGIIGRSQNDRITPFLPIIETDYIYNTEEEAEKAMEKLVIIIRAKPENAQFEVDPNS